MQPNNRQNRLQEIGEILIQGILRLKLRENQIKTRTPAEETGHQRRSKACTRHSSTKSK